MTVGFHPTAVVLLHSLLFLLQPLKTSAGGTACSILPAAGCAATQASPPPPYSHRWPSHPSTDPHLLLFSGDGRRTSKPSYSRTPLRVGIHCWCLPRLCVVPFLGLVVVHRRGALGAAWSMCSMTDFHRKSTVRGEVDSWVHGGRKEVPPYYAQNNYSST